MQREITIVVAVNDFNHAEVIRTDIEKAVKLRTTIYHVGEHKNPELNVSQHIEIDEKGGNSDE